MGFTHVFRLLRTWVSVKMLTVTCRYTCSQTLLTRTLSRSGFRRPPSSRVLVDVAGFNLGTLVTSKIRANFALYSTSFVLMSRTSRKVLVLPSNHINTCISIGIRSGRLISRNSRRIQVLISRNEESLVQIPKGA